MSDLHALQAYHSDEPPSTPEPPRPETQAQMTPMAAILTRLATLEARIATLERRANEQEAGK